VNDRYRWQPGSPAQKAALDSEANILFFGGSAGSLKTATMLMDAVQEYRNPNLRGIIFRSSFQEMTDIIDKTRQMYPPLGGTFVGSPKYTWTFQSGATIRFAYMKTDDDVWKYLGPRYSFIGFDESTLHTEKQVRNILGRLSSTDRSLRLRMRLGSNPGNVGAAWHQKLFLRGHCPVHEPDQCAKPGKLYWDRTWSDGEPIPFSVAFIPGKLSDHTFLDEGYDRRLGMMDAASADAMRFGCWCTLQGAYFPFLNRSHKVSVAEIDIQPWHNHFISIDYGMGQSSAAAGLFVRTPAEYHRPITIQGIRSEPVEPQFPNGRIRQIGEICEPMMPVDVFARRVVDGFIAPSGVEQPHSIVAVFLDPNNFNPDYDMRHGTGGQAVSDQIDKVFEPWGLSCQRSNNQRGNGWQLLSRMLRDGEFQFTDFSPETYESIRTRMIDPDKYLDIVKVKGDPLDDLADMVRYAVYTWINPADKPRELQLREAVAGIDRSTREGVTSAMIRYQQTEERLDQEQAPPRFGSRRMGFGRRR
jgi:hypothetical protein